MAMTISGPRIDDRQLRLFEADRRIKTLGHARTFVGDIFEDYSAEVFDATRLKTDATVDVCPDLKFSERRFAEVKSSGLNNQVILYQERCARYDAFVAEGYELRYIIFRHAAAIAGVEWLSELQTLLIGSLRRIVTVNATDLHRWTRKNKKLRVVNGAHGNPKYHLGWTVSVSQIQKISTAITCEIR